MIRSRRLAAVAALVTMLATLALGAGAASADPGRGAIVVHDSACTTSSTGTFCSTVHTVFNSTATPSGNFIGVLNSKFENTFTGAGFLEGCHSSSSGTAHQQSLFQDIETQEFHNHNKGEFSFSCFGFELTCVFDVHVHFAQGEFQFSRPEFNCS